MATMAQVRSGHRLRQRVSFAVKCLNLTYPCIYENTYIPLVNQLTLKLSKMKKGTKEFYEIMQEFERTIKQCGIYVGCKIERESRESRNYYTNGNLNNLFIMFVHGYQVAKCMARIEALELSN